MIRDQKFDKRYIEMELQKLNGALPRRTRIFVAGGAAMAFYGLKEATKDIDVVVEKRTELRSLVSALHGLGYKRRRGSLELTCAKIGASAILENTDGFRWDIFERVISRKLGRYPAPFGFDFGADTVSGTAGSRGASQHQDRSSNTRWSPWVT